MTTHPSQCKQALAYIRMTTTPTTHEENKIFTFQRFPSTIMPHFSLPLSRFARRWMICSHATSGRSWNSRKSWLGWNSKELYSTWIISNLWAPRSLEMCWCWSEDFKWKVFHLHRMNKTFASFSYYRNQFLQCAIWNAKDQARRGYAWKLSRVVRWDISSTAVRVSRSIIDSGSINWGDEEDGWMKIELMPNSIILNFALPRLSHLSLKHTTEFLFRSSLLFSSTSTSHDLILRNEMENWRMFELFFVEQWRANFPTFRLVLLATCD